MTPPGLQRIRVETNPSYTIHIGEGISGALADWLVSSARGRRCAMVTDANVAGLHAPAVKAALSGAGIDVEMVVFPAGETSKTRAMKEQVEDSLLGAGLGRDSILISLGGGVVTDLAGFVAATYMRGIPHVPVPTTLLGMVDAAIGGKTGVDHPKGKNLIGAFHQPAAVFIEIGFLGSLPDQEFRCGLTEIVKAAVIRDAKLFSEIGQQAEQIKARDPKTMTRLILAAARIKAEIVAADEKEGDLRKILNFGHTVGHAIEQLSGYSLSHGEAVAAGMVVEGRIAVALGLLTEVDAASLESLLEKLKLSLKLTDIRPALEPEAIVEAARADKKTRGGQLACALPSGIGTMAKGPEGFGIPLEEGLLLTILKDLQQAQKAT
jgi:3-dehydroquinate synthase